MKKISSLSFVLALLALCGCKEEVIVPVSYDSISYKDIKPIVVSVDSTQSSIEFVKKEIKLRYPVMVGDTLDVHILDFQSDVYALDYYMNSGHFQGSLPILRGDYQEQSIRADSKIFIFRHDSYRKYERGDLESFVRSFPEYKGGFPQEFLSLPFDKRVSGKASIQTKSFLGVQSTFPILAQSYQNDGLRWNVARSWDVVDPKTYMQWANSLQKVVPQGIMPQSDNVYFTAGEGIMGIATQLIGGRVVVVWGYLDWFDLERTLFAVSDRVYDSRF